MYRAIGQNDVDAIIAFTTDSRIQYYKLRVLKDNKNFFPPYDAAPLVRMSILKKTS